MQALTRLNPTDPVRFDGMNTILGEIEGRDEDLLNKINELSEADVDLLDKINVLLSMVNVQYINGETVTLSDYKEQGIYCFSSECTINDIPVGLNGWLIVLPTNRTKPNVECKQLWLRWGTASSNSWMTYERLVTPTIIGEWTPYGVTKKYTIDYPYPEGFIVSRAGDASNIEKVNNQVLVHINIKKGDGSDIGYNDVLGTLPNGYRPSGVIWGVACQINTGKTYPIIVNTVGKIYARVPTGVKEVVTSIMFFV